MKINKTICIDQDLIYSEKIHELIKSQKFSGLINDLLRTHLNINTSKVSEDLAKEELEQRLKEISVRKTELQKQLDIIEAKIPKLSPQEEAEGWFIDEEGKKWKKIA